MDDQEKEKAIDVDSELDKRKLSYMRLANGAKPQTQTSVSFFILVPFVETHVEILVLDKQIHLSIYRTQSSAQ